MEKKNGISFPPLYFRSQIYIMIKTYFGPTLRKINTVNIPGYENLSMAWQALCHQAGTFENLLEVKGVSKSFTKIQQFLR